MKTNEELVKRLKAAGEGTTEAAAIMGQLWERNKKLIKYTVHRLTGLQDWQQGHEDMMQQAYFGFHAAAFAYDSAAGNKFSSFAVNRIEWELSAYYAQNGFAVCLPGSMWRRIKEFRRVKKQLEAERGRPISTRTALNAMGLSPEAIEDTISVLQKQETTSLETPAATGTDGEGDALGYFIPDKTDVEGMVIEQVWHEELHDILMKALGAIPEMERGIIIRHYFADISFAQQAREYGLTRQTVLNKADKGLEAIRGGEYGAELAEFMPSTSAYKRACKSVTRTKNDMHRLNLEDDEKEMLAL